MKKLVFLLCFLFAAPAFAQDRAISGTTVQTTDTSANSLLIGCSIGSTTCTGGIKAGAIVIGGGTSITSSSNIALLNAVNTFTGFGAHTWTAGGTGINQINVRNSSAGTTNYGRVGATSDTVNTYLEATSSTFTATGVQPQAGGAVYTDGSGGLSVGATASAPIKFYTAGALRWGINSAGDHTFGASARIADSSGTPTLTTCTNCGTGNTLVTGSTDYAITWTQTGAGSGALTILITFGHSFASAPVCVASTTFAAATATIRLTTSSTNVTVTTSADAGAGGGVYLLCRGKDA